MSSHARVSVGTSATALHDAAFALSFDLHLRLAGYGGGLAEFEGAT